MGLFGLSTSKGKGGGLMNVIRCDEAEYLVWKWRPLGQDANSTSRENSIRYGSSLRVKDGEVAVFVYKQQNGLLQDFIVGPYDDTIKTANLAANHHFRRKYILLTYRVIIKSNLLYRILMLWILAYLTILFLSLSEEL